jgi:hypothetical protein
MSNLKHVGRYISNKRKVVVAYRVIPGDSDHCLVVPTESLMAEEHDTLMKLVESDAGQNSYELAEAMARTRLPDGRIMLAAFHTTGKFNKAPSSTIEMTPNRNTSVNLQELNEMVAQQRGVTIEDLAIKPSAQTEQQQTPAEEPVQEVASTEEAVITDEELAAQYRSQADSLFKEAKRLREQAEELVPTKRKKKTEESA